MQTATNAPRLLSVEDAARALGAVSARHVRRLIARGELPAVHVGRRVLVAVQDIDAYVEQLRRNASGAAA